METMKCDTRIELRLPALLRAKAEAHAARRGESVAGLIRRAIEATLQSEANGKQSKGNAAA